MSTEYVIASAEAPVAIASLAAAFPKRLRIDGSWERSIKIGEKLRISIDQRHPAAKAELTAAQRKTVYVLRGDYDLMLAFGAHVRGVWVSEDEGAICRRWDVEPKNVAAPLPATMFIVPRKKAGATLPTPRYVDECLSSIDVAKGSDWEGGFHLRKVSLRAPRRSDKLPKGAPKGTAVVTIGKHSKKELEDIVIVLDCMADCLDGRLVAEDGSPIELPESF